MVNGRITLSGTGKELLERPDVQTAYLDGGAKSPATKGVASKGRPA